MKKTLLGWLVCGLLLCMCATACAVEPPAIDYEGLAERLQAQGILIPQTLEAAMGDFTVDTLPEYELTIDEKNDQYILHVEIAEGYFELLTEDGKATAFQKAKEPGVYTVKGIGDYSTLQLIEHNARGVKDDVIWCCFELSDGRCSTYRYIQNLPGAIQIIRDLVSYGNGDGGFWYSVADNKHTPNTTLELSFDLGSGDLNLCAVSTLDNDTFAYQCVSFQNGELFGINVDDYCYHAPSIDPWTKNGVPCEAPFEVTPDMYPYPSFMPQ